MAPIEFNWNNDNGNRIYAVEWPAREARAVIGLIHGIGEHCRRYDEMAAWYNQHDIAVVGYDRQGFGRSEGRKGYAKDYKEYIDEIAKLLIACERRYHDTPVFLYGHSMGGHLLLRYLIRRHPNISGAIVSAAHIRLSYTPSALLVGLGKLMRNIYPTFTQDNLLDTNLLSRTPTVKPQYDADPLVHPKLTSRTGIDILENAAALDAYSDGLKLPTLMMHGAADGLTSPEGTKAFADRNPDNLTLKIWPELYHELHLEPEREQVFSYVLNWIEKQLSEVHRKPKSV
jgi:alpha-beta hydrolase superfamily lysophospholipase